MGSSAKKKREKKKDFQVSDQVDHTVRLLNWFLEAEAESRKSTAKSS